MSSSESSPSGGEDLNETSSWCFGKVRVSEEAELSLQHPKFSTKPGLVAGMYYQGTFWKMLL